jgi:multimeric flavodoxin WrbA
MKVLIPFYSLYGHVYQMALAVAEGVAQVEGAEAVIRRVPETLPAEVIEKMGAVRCDSFWMLPGSYGNPEDWLARWQVCL